MKPTIALLVIAVAVAVAGCTGSATPDREADQREAAAALSSFFERLNRGDFAEAAPLYGGSFDHLRSINPDVDPADGPALLRQACQFNGFRCLPAGQITPVGVAPDGAFVFAVEFLQEDGSTFALGPCCGEDPSAQPEQTSFEFTVRGAADRGFVVLELPPYVP